MSVKKPKYTKDHTNKSKESRDHSTFKTIVKNPNDPYQLLTYALHKSHVISATEKYKDNPALQAKKRIEYKHDFLAEDLIEEKIKKANSLVKETFDIILHNKKAEVIESFLEPHLRKCILPVIDDMAKVNEKAVTDTTSAAISRLDDVINIFHLTNKTKSIIWVNFKASIATVSLLFLLSLLADISPLRSKRVWLANKILPSDIIVVDTTDKKIVTPASSKGI